MVTSLQFEVPIGREGYFAGLAATESQLFFMDMGEPSDPVAELGLVSKNDEFCHFNRGILYQKRGILCQKR